MNFGTRWTIPKLICAGKQGTALGRIPYSRALSHQATLVEPKRPGLADLASYARDGLARVEAAGDPPFTRATVRTGLGGGPWHPIQYRTRDRWLLPVDAGADALLRCLLRLGPLGASNTGAQPFPFDWRSTASYLRVPVLEALYQQVALYSQLHVPRPGRGAGLDSSGPGTSG